MMDGLGFTHHFEPGLVGRTPLLLLHGTGGDERDLLPLSRQIAPGSPLLAPRGQVDESGLLRFFRRKAEGVFDEQDLRARVDDLAAFIGAARTRYILDAPVAVGLSNGANIAAAMLLLRPDVLAGAALLRAMPPFRLMPPQPALAGKPILLLSGTADAIVPDEAAVKLARALAGSGADLEHRTLPAGHGLTTTDVALMQQWLGHFNGRRLRSQTT